MMIMMKRLVMGLLGWRDEKKKVFLFCFSIFLFIFAEDKLHLGKQSCIWTR